MGKEGRAKVKSVQSEEQLNRSDSDTKLNVSTGKPPYRQKNARLTQVIPPDVLLLKGEVLRSAISHLEVGSSV